MTRTGVLSSSLRRVGMAVATMALIVSFLSLSYGKTVYADVTPDSASTLGADVDSWNCGGAVPKSQAFGIVGVNDVSSGKAPAFSTSQCLLSEIRWAQRSTGAVKNQPKVQFLITPADPGNTSPYWPKIGLTDPLGVCKIVNGKGENTPACAFHYGETLASYDVEAVKDDGIANGYTYWIEASNQIHLSWLSPRMNDAVLDGIATYLKSTGNTIGIQSTPAQWANIAGSFTAQQFRDLYGLDNWTYITSSTAQARNFCQNPATHTFDNGKLDLVEMINSASSTNWDLAC